LGENERGKIKVGELSESRFASGVQVCFFATQQCFDCALTPATNRHPISYSDIIRITPGKKKGAPHYIGHSMEKQVVEPNFAGINYLL
jgi:hypothetical protein